MKGDNICKSTIVHKALEGSIRLSNNVQFWLNWPLLFFYNWYLLLCLLIYKLSKWKLLNYGLKIHNYQEVCWFMKNLPTWHAYHENLMNLHDQHVIKTVVDWWIINLGPSYTVSGNLGEGLSPVPETKWMGPSLFSLHVEPSGLTI